MRFLKSITAANAAVSLAFLVGCSGSGAPAFTTEPATFQSGAHGTIANVPAILSMRGLPNFRATTGHPYKSFFACPANGPIKYVADYNNNVINVFTGKFAGQSPCGRITSGLSSPWGLYVEPGTHDLYVANDTDQDILVFHRGQTTAYNTYRDPGQQDPVDVTVAKDGTVIASNFVQINFREAGSISTWIKGPNGGTFVGNFPASNGSTAMFVTVQKNGTIYFDDYPNQTNVGVLYSLSCPAGKCGAQTQVAGVSFNVPGGLASDETEDLLADNGFGTAQTFELPNPNPSTFPVLGVPTGMAINELDHHWFVADGSDNDAAEYSYPDGKLIGTVAGDPGGGTFGVAVDPGHVR
jgi:hypothetical protein